MIAPRSAVRSSSGRSTTQHPHSARASLSRRASSRRSSPPLQSAGNATDAPQPGHFQVLGVPITAKKEPFQTRGENRSATTSIGREGPTHEARGRGSSVRSGLGQGPTICHRSTGKSRSGGPARLRTALAGCPVHLILTPKIFWPRVPTTIVSPKTAGEASVFVPRLMELSTLPVLPSIRNMVPTESHCTM